MRLICLFILSLLFYNSCAFGQGSTFQLWTQKGIKLAINKRFSLGADWTNRIGENGFETVFPQVNVKYKVANWFKPSIDLRYIIDKSSSGNYSGSGRINFNAQFNYEKKRIIAGLRLRYQYGFERMNADYDSDFDVAYRIKPQFSYDINNCIFSPVLNFEFFYDPAYSALGRRFNKIRYFVGTSLDFSGPHAVEFGYQYDQKINLPGPINKHVISLSYTYTVKKKKVKKNTEQPKNSKTL